MHPALRLACGCGLLVVAACVSPMQSPVSSTATLPVPSDPQVVAGQAVWEKSCQVCHGPGLSGAPRLQDPAAWAPRIAQGKSVLYSRSIDGYYGPSGAHMPARGGNASLSDAQVSAAVDYAIWILETNAKE